jgi:hypothetical protein
VAAVGMCGAESLSARGVDGEVAVVQGGVMFAVAEDEVVAVGGAAVGPGNLTQGPCRAFTKCRRTEAWSRRCPDMPNWGRFVLLTAVLARRRPAPPRWPCIKPPVNPLTCEDAESWFEMGVT